MGVDTDLAIGDQECVYVPTGGMIPSGADAMLMIEDSEKLDELTVAVYKAITKGTNIIYKGDDIKAGKRILKRGKVLDHNDIGVLAALGIENVLVREKLRVTVLSTGDEIIPIGGKLSLGKVRDINGYVLKSMLKSMNCEVVRHDIINDDYEMLLESVAEGIADSHLVLLSGGSSVGARDFTHKVIESFDRGKVHVHGITIKPGKPTIIGTVDNRLVVGLPGHPVSSIMVYKAFIEPFIARVTGETIRNQKLKGILESNVHSDPGKRTYQMVKIMEDSGGIMPYYGKSGMISLLADAHGYIIMEPDVEGLPKGEVVEVTLF